MVVKKPFRPIQPDLGLTIPPISNVHPAFRPKAWRKTGPKILHLSKEATVISGPGFMPDAFNSGKTSQSEWVLYWAMCRIHGTPENPRVGPYEGDHGSPPKWAYQKYVPILGVTGKTNLDFVAYFQGHIIGVRLESERFHMEADPIQKALDEWLRTHNLTVHQVINVFEQEYMWDTTGAAACMVMADASRGIEHNSPLKLGNYWRTREDWGRPK